jgi:ABC-type polysaccharide/polyol phosphate transport system ATPase subunit
MRRPLAIEVRNVSKSFRIPSNRLPTLKQRVLHPFQTQGHRQLHALDDVSLEVAQGEFMGIVGRNGSGKSTLLKLIASIYRADRGRIRVAGRLAPFIELGVGFNPEMTAYDNVVMNGVMMGLTRREARKRCDQVIEFAELEEFIELKLRNYSSGMRVRLAFAVMVQVDADVMLFDEVLAVGDAGFQERCSETFFGLRERGKTVVLVTHSMPSVMTYCHRAMLIESGRIETVGDPVEVATRYTELNFPRQRGEPSDRRLPARVSDAWIEGSTGERTGTVQRRERVGLEVEIEVDEDIDDPVFGFEIWTVAGARLFMADSTALSEQKSLRAGDRRRVSATIENRLAPGHYRLNCAVAGHRPGGSALLTSRVHGVDLEVTGESLFGSRVDLAHETRVEPDVRTEVAQP